MMKVNVNTTPTLTIKVETFRSDKKYFEQPKPTLNNLAQTEIPQQMSFIFTIRIFLYYSIVGV